MYAFTIIFKVKPLHPWVDDQGISDTPKGAPRRASPTARANPCRVLVSPNKNKDIHKGGRSGYLRYPKGAPRRASPTARANPCRVLVSPNKNKDIHKGGRSGYLRYPQRGPSESVAYGSREPLQGSRIAKQK